MIHIIDRLSTIWKNESQPFLIYDNKKLYFSDIQKKQSDNISEIKSGDVVALIGDFEPKSISNLFSLFDKGAIVVPLTKETREQHQYFFDVAQVDFIIEDEKVQRRKHSDFHPLIEQLKQNGNSGVVFFSTGTTGRPKAILHDMKLFMKRYETPRPTLCTMNFLLFDHLGGLSTLLHTLFNKGLVVAPRGRSVEEILYLSKKYEVEALPATPTFLRMMALSGYLEQQFPSCLKIITYGSERMDQPTLDLLCELLPNVDFRQTYGTTELGIVRVKSKSRNSLYMKIGGEGIETRVIDGVLHIRSQTRMLGYLNAETPISADGWYDTKDVVTVEGEYIKITGRTSEVINVGGLKFMASEVERVVMEFSGVSLAKVIAKDNPITGQHVELIVQPKENSSISKTEIKNFLIRGLQSHMVPQRITISTVNVGHRFKRG